ncbi:hypothetical protein Pla100_12030 [Neorhodopirellula pilleata]|uniref:Uncharacterized protein n=1 Tax=Neorhodopirellula pilleata TaxID=2714738 RepID=A0A5C6AQG7_9BACT|nr:hypothetical protein Pla100_12030 [Neorhodopirellula pilleata]
MSCPQRTGGRAPGSDAGFGIDGRVCSLQTYRFWDRACLGEKCLVYHDCSTKMRSTTS